MRAFFLAILFLLSTMSLSLATVTGIPTKTSPSAPAAPRATKADIDALMKKAQQGDMAAFQTVVDKGDQHDPQALFELGLAYLYGTSGVAKDEPKAINYLFEAAKAGSAQAACDLAIAYAKGESVPKSMESAAQWFKWAADRGDADAEGNLGIFYMKGLGGLDEDTEQAYLWLSLSVKQGNTTKPLSDLNAQLLEQVKSGMTLEEIGFAEKSVRGWKPVAATTTPGW